MAIVVTYNPNSNTRFKCAANRIDFLAINTDTSVSQMTFKFALYNPLTGGLASQTDFVVTKDGAGNFYKNFSAIGQRSLSYDIPEFGDCTNAINSSREVVLSIEEQVYSAVIHNSFLSVEEWRASRQEEYEFENGDLLFPDKKHFIRNYNNKIDIDRSSFLLQSFVRDLSTLRGYLITCYNEAGDEVNSGTIFFTGVPGYVYTEGRIMCDVGTGNIKNVLGSTFFDDAVKYKVELEYTDLSVQGVPLWFTLVDYCRPYVRIHWLNTLGGWDAFDFPMIQRKTIQAEKVDYVGKDYSIVNNEVVDNILNTKTSYVKRSKAIEINSDWINDEESLSVSELILSRLVLMETYNADGETEFVSVSVQEKSIEQKNSFNDTLFNYSFNITNNDSNSQVL
jgi:hypothetical protein